MQDAARMLMKEVRMKNLNPEARAMGDLLTCQGGGSKTLQVGPLVLVRGLNA